MKKLATLTITGLLALGSSQINAAQTNLVQNLSLKLVAYSQGLSTTNKNIVNENLNTGTISTKQVISVLGTATTNDFSSSAALVVVTPLVGGTNGTPSIVINDGSNSVDVTSFFNITNYSNEAHSATFKSGTLVTETRYRFRGFDLVDNTNYPSLGLHFATAGLWTDSINPIVSRAGVLGYNSEVTFTVNGKGESGSTKNLVLTGTISLGSGKVIVK